MPLKISNFRGAFNRETGSNPKAIDASISRPIYIPHLNIERRSFDHLAGLWSKWREKTFAIKATESSFGWVGVVEEKVGSICINNFRRRWNPIFGSGP